MIMITAAEMTQFKSNFLSQNKISDDQTNLSKYSDTKISSNQNNNNFSPISSFSSAFNSFQMQRR